MIKPSDQPEAVRRFCGAVSNLSAELLQSGVGHAALAAGLRVEAGKIEVAAPRIGMSTDEVELAGLVRQAHDFINTLMIVGIDEPVAVSAINNALVERVARTRGAAGAANWLRSIANLVEANAASIEETARAH